MQVRVKPEDRDALRFHWIKDTEKKEVETLRFTRPLFGLAPSPFLLAGVIDQHLDTWSDKRPEVVAEVNKSLYVDDLISGGITTAKAKENKITAVEIFADAAFELHKWHSNVPELESADTDQNEGDHETYAKQQLGTPQRGGGAILGLKWNKLEDTLVSLYQLRKPRTPRGEF